MTPLEQFLAAFDGLEGADLEGAVRLAFLGVQSELPAALANAISAAADDAAEVGGELLADSHARSAYLGRRLAGNTVPFGDYDEQFGKLVGERQAQYLEGFLAQINNGDYTDETGALDLDAIETRAGFYQHALRGTANEAWVNTLGDQDDLIYWDCNDDGASCSICPDLEQSSPHKANQLPTYPGANETPCLFNCRCELRTESGARGF